MVDSAVIDALWETVSESCPKLVRNWLNDNDEAKREITSTLTNDDKWKYPTMNFLLRLISDQPKPHVELALAFVRHMSQNPVFTDFIQSTLDVHEESVNVIGVTDLIAGVFNSPTDVGRDEKKRCNWILLHEAAKRGRCVDLKQFLSPTNVNARNNIGETALHLAAEFEHSQDVEILLDAGATIEVTLS